MGGEKVEERGHGERTGETEKWRTGVMHFESEAEK